MARMQDPARAPVRPWADATRRRDDLSAVGAVAVSALVAVALRTAERWREVRAAERAAPDRAP
jgi:hypothetical protein